MNDNELKIEVSGGRVIEAKVRPNGCCVLTVELAITTTEDATCHKQKGLFKKVPASELRLDDKFLKHQPKTKRERNFKNLVEIAIQNGLKDFWCPVCEPSFDGNGRICYEPGKKPAVGKSYNWWAKTAKEFKPEQGSRLGTKSEYVAFLATLIKELVASGWKVADAWSAVCNDSKELGHFWNSKDAKHDFEPTGSREVCGWCDFGNTYKILAEDKEAGRFWLAGGYYDKSSGNSPLVGLYLYDYNFRVYKFSCGWMVFDSCPDC